MDSASLALRLREFVDVEGLIIDLFAGGGGVSLGIQWATGRSPDEAVNHDPAALAMHALNHPTTRHHCESVYKVKPRVVCAGRRVALLHLSPDCKHFSKAKGGKPVDKKIRGLAWIALTWARKAPPDVITLENVEEFEMWGPLGPDKKPDPKRKGMLFKSWCTQLRNCGYVLEWRQLRACDYGAPTSRKRFFLIARRDGKPIVWPTPTHGKGRIPYRTAAECIDWSIPVPSIFLSTEEGRELGVKRPLEDATLKRIARGIWRYVLDASNPFVVPGNDDKEPATAPFLTEHANASKQRIFSVEEPLRTQCAQVKGGHFALVAATLVQSGYGERKGQAPRSLDIRDPLGTIVAQGTKHALVTAFLGQANTGMIGHDMREPLSTIISKGCTQRLIASELVKLDQADRQRGLLEAGGPKLKRAREVYAFLIKYYKTGTALSLFHPIHTVTTDDRFGLVTVTISGTPYVIVDIGMRMLSPRELFRCQGFPDSYVIDFMHQGKPIAKKAQVRMVGNSVPPQLEEALVRANFPARRMRVAA